MYFFAERIFLLYASPVRPSFHPKHIARIPLVLDNPFLCPQLVLILLIAMILPVPTDSVSSFAILRVIYFRLSYFTLTDARILYLMLIICKPIEDEYATNGEVCLREVLLPLPVPASVLEISLIYGSVCD